MKHSANTTRKKKATKLGTEDLPSVESAMAAKAIVPGGSQPAKKVQRRKAIAPARQVAVHYTRRIPGAHCPGC